MNSSSSFRSGSLLLLGIALLAASAAIHAIVLNSTWWTWLTAGLGGALTLWGGFALRGELGALLTQRRAAIALHGLGWVTALVALAYLSLLFSWRFDMTTGRKYSLSEPTVKMLKTIDKPVRITFFHDPMMRETVELYQQMVKQNPRISLELFDPMLNPAQARLMGVQFAGTAIMRSEDRKLTINGPTETDIANGILRVSQGAKERVCFLDGHKEADPFSAESHDHMEGDAGHSHGLGSKLVIHEQHGMAKARNALENLNYTVEKVSTLKGDASLAQCAVLVVAGPKFELLPREVLAVQSYLDGGGNALFMLDPFVHSGLESILLKYSISLDNDIVIDDASHFWADPSAPAVTEYNFHQITRELPLTFFPGARSLSPTPQRVPGTTATPLVNSSKKSYGETTPDRAEYKEGEDKAGPLTMVAVAKRKAATVDSAMQALMRLRAEGASADADKSAAAPSAEADVKPSRIAVVGDSDFATNSFFHLLGNGKLFLNTVNYLAAQENLIGVEPRTYDMPRVNLTNRQMKGTVFLSVVLIPGLLAIIGTAVWWRQR